MARIIFIGIVVAVVVFVWRGRDSAHGRAVKRLMLLGFAGLVIFTILFPEITSVVATGLGIGRGTDLVSYMTSFAVMFLAAFTYIKNKRLEDRIAALASEIALRDWDRELRAAGLDSADSDQPGSGTADASRPEPR